MALYATAFPAALDTVSTLGDAVDNLVGLLDGDHTAAITTISLVDASSFPATGGAILIDNELITYTGKSTNDLTGATRGAFGSTASTHGNRAEVIYAQVAAYIDVLVAALIAIETKLGIDDGAMGSLSGPKQFTTAGKPAAASVSEGTCIWVTDPTAGQNLQVSDGAVWKYVTLNALT